MSSSFVVEAGFSSGSNLFVIGSSLLGGTDVLAGQLGFTWTPITQWVKHDSLRWRTGSTRSQGPWWRAQAGSFSFTLDNSDGSDRFNPKNLSGPYVSAGRSKCRPGLAIRISINVNGTLEPQLQGWVDTWDPKYDNNLLSTISVTGTDGIERLQSANLGALASPVGAGDYAGNRINRILDSIGWDANSRDVSNPSDGSTMQATSLAQAAWSEILLTADSDAGMVWISRDGKVTYRRYNQIPLSPEFTWSPTGTYSYTDAEISYDRQQVYNVIRLARAGGVEQELEDVNSSSQDVNGYRTHARSDLIAETDAQVQAIAQVILYNFATLVVRVESITVDILPSDSDSVWSAYSHLGVGMRAQVTHPALGTAITTQQIIRGVEWQSVDGGTAARVVVSFQTTAASAVPFVINSSLLGGTDVLFSRLS